jgi:hypothetical protein
LHVPTLLSLSAQILMAPGIANENVPQLLSGAPNL